MTGMTLSDAVAIVESTLESELLRVDRRLAREDREAFLLLVLDTSGGRHDEGPLANGPRLVDKQRATVSRLTVPDAVERAERMALVAP
jgi:hypothetical protein